MLDAALSVMMLAGAALLGGAYLLWKKGAPMKRVALMIAAAMVLFLNIAIWTVPTKSGASPAELAAGRE